MNEKLNEAGSKDVDEMAALERQLAAGSQSADDTGRKVGFVSAGVESQPAVINALDGGRELIAIQEDIELPDESDSEDESEIAQKSVPSAVFGELAQLAKASKDSGTEEIQEDRQLGALERIKRQRRQ